MHSLLVHNPLSLEEVPHSALPSEGQLSYLINFFLFCRLTVQQLLKISNDPILHFIQISYSYLPSYILSSLVVYKATVIVLRKGKICIVSNCQYCLKCWSATRAFVTPEHCTCDRYPRRLVGEVTAATHINWWSMD